MMDKERLLDLAEVLDAWRTFPRFFCAGYGVLLGYVTVWYCKLPHASVDQTAFIGTIYGVAGVILKFYLDGGYDWIKRREDKNAKPNPT